MTVHFFTKGDERLPDSRQRAFRIAEELNARGIAAIVHRPSVLQISETRWPKKLQLIFSTIRSLFSIRPDDIVFLQRTISNKYFFVSIVAYLSVFRRKMIFDFDDAIYLHDSFKTKVLTRMADAVIVCSRALEAWARTYNDNIYVIHTTVKLADYERFTNEYSSEPERVTIGWTGVARNHYENLRFLSGVLARLGKEEIPCRFVLVGAGHIQKIHELFENIPGLQVEFIDDLAWDDPESIPREIQKFDIGVNPLVDKGEWNLARSSFKPYEYMACGVANITSAVGEITFVIQDGVNGMLADSEDEWVEKMTRLISDKGLRAKLGRAGQETMRTKEAFEVVIPRLVTILEAL